MEDGIIVIMNAFRDTCIINVYKVNPILNASGDLTISKNSSSIKFDSMQILFNGILCFCKEESFTMHPAFSYILY